MSNCRTKKEEVNMKKHIVKKVFILSVIALWGFLSCNAPAENVILVEDYNDTDLSRNTLGFWTGSNLGKKSKEIELYSYNQNHETNWTNYKETNRAKKISYNCSKKGDFWYATNLWDDATHLDISAFTHLSFRVKGKKGGEDFYIQLQDGVPVNDGPEPLIEIHSSDYFTVGDEWQQVDIDLSAFSGLDRTKMRAISMEFRASLNMTKGTIYLDNLAFSKGVGKPESTGPVRIERETNRLFVDGQPFTVKGVGYQPTPIGDPVYPPFYGRYSAAYTAEVYERDLSLLEEMGCNTLKTWGDPGKVLMYDAAATYGLKVIAGFWMDGNLDYANSDVRDTAKLNFKRYVNKYKDSPALLMWAIGNECNYSSTIKHKYYYSLCNELAEIAYSLEGGTYHPAIIVNGKLHHIGIGDYNTLDAQLDYVDAWGANLYAKKYRAVDWFTRPAMGIFEVYKDKSSKPLVITEYGADAFYTTSTYPLIDGYVDEDAQASRVRHNTLNILAASDVCLGGCVMEYSDEWWKDSSGELDTHDAGPGYAWYSHLPDGYVNEEYWGIVSVEKNIEQGMPDIVTPRRAYYKLKAIFTK